MSRVAVIVVNWDDDPKIGTSLDSVFAQREVRDDPAFVEVIVSDNGSRPESRAFLRERYGDRVRIVENGANLGFAGAVNRGVAATDADYVLLLNPDAELLDHAIANLVAFADAHPRCAIAGSRIYNADGSLQPSAGEFDTWAGAFLRSSAWGELAPLRRYANGAALRDYDYDTDRRVDLVIGAVMLIRRALFAEIGPFDERFFLYHEEVDFAKRAAEAGWETWLVASAEAMHEGEGSARGRYRVETRKQRSRRAYWIKHHGWPWYLALVAALVGRYVLYLGIVAAPVAALRRARRRNG